VESPEEKVGFRTKVKRFFQRFELQAEAPQNLLTAGLWQTVGTMVASILSWLLVLVVSREDIGIGPVGIGILNTASALLSVFSLVIMGMSKATSQKVSEKFSDKKLAFQHARNGTFITIIFGIVIGICLIVGAFFIGNPFTLQDELSSILLILGITMLFVGFREGFSANLAAVGEYDEIVKAGVMLQLSRFISGIIIIIIIKSIIGPAFTGLILLILIISTIVQVLFLYRFLGKLWFNKQIFRFTKVDRKTFGIVRQGLYFAVTDIIPVGLLGATSTILLLFFTGDYHIVGAYSIAIGYSIGGLIVAGFAWPIITSVAEAYGQGDTERIHRYLNLILKLFFYLTFLMIAISIGLSRGILNIFHGTDYTTTYDVWLPFILVVSAFTIAGFEYIMCSVLLGVGKGRPAATYLGSIFLVSVGFISLFLWLEPFTPQINAGLGFLTGTVIMLPILPILVKKNLKHGISKAVPLRSTLALLCSLALPAILTWPPLELIVFNNIWLLILLAITIAITYPIFLVFFGAITDEDFDLIDRKIEEYGLGKYIGPIIGILRKINNISPFRRTEANYKCD
jgi:O-antigen/teichoic acid export membrane protein